MPRHGLAPPPCLIALLPLDIPKDQLKSSGGVWPLTNKER